MKPGVFFVLFFVIILIKFSFSRFYEDECLEFINIFQMFCCIVCTLTVFFSSLGGTNALVKLDFIERILNVCVILSLSLFVSIPVCLCARALDEKCEEEVLTRE